MTNPIGKLPEGCFVVGSGIYAICEVCRKIVRLNKPIIGSMHICAQREPITK